jgi:hypothetical protein
VERAWKGAVSIAPARAVGVHARQCTVRQLGRWYNVRCPGLVTAAITEEGNSAPHRTEDNVQFNLDPAADDGMPREGEVVFELSEGQSRTFSFWTFGDGYDGPLTVIAGVTVQARHQNDHVTLLLHDALDQPIRTAQSERRKRHVSAESDSRR